MGADEPMYRDRSSWDTDPVRLPGSRLADRGRPSDRLGRRRAFVLTACIIYSLALSVLALVTELNGFLVEIAIGGIGFGLYVQVISLSSLMCSSTKADAGKDL